jgi:hypothetical protein
VLLCRQCHCYPAFKRQGKCACVCYVYTFVVCGVHVCSVCVCVSCVVCTFAVYVYVYRVWCACLQCMCIVWCVYLFFLMLWFVCLIKFVLVNFLQTTDIEEGCKGHRRHQIGGLPPCNTTNVCRTIVFYDLIRSLTKLFIHEKRLERLGSIVVNDLSGNH